jgi:hypothetical protein
MRKNRRAADQKTSLRPFRGRKMQLEGLEGRLALAIAGLGVAGDSWSDEYAAETYNYARNWAELLVSERGIDLGAPGNYTDGRGNNGTAFNWAESDATALDLLIDSQDINIADQFATGDVSHAVLMIGNVYFAPGSEKFTKIADGTWSQAQIDSEITFMTFNIEGAISVLSGVPTKALVATIPDPTMTPAGSVLFTAAGRDKVRAAVTAVNVKIKEFAAKYHQPVVDLAALSTAILGSAASPAASRTIGGNVYSVAGGTPKTNLFIQGGVLPHTVFQAYVANAVIEGLNTAYNENIARLTEQQIVTLAGQTYGGTDTFPVNYSSLIIQPPVTVFVDFGKTSTPSDDFTARISELASARGIPQLTPDVNDVPGELSQLKANILAKLTTAFAGTTINFTGEKPADTRFEAVKVGRLSASVPGALTSAIGQGTFDWLNSSETTTGFVFPDLITFNATAGAAFDNINLAALPRASQLRYLENVLSFYIANEAGRGMGLSASDAYAYPEITTANSAATGGVQYQDFMSGDPALGFNTGVFNGTPAFRFSPLALAKLKEGRWLANPQIATVAEVATPHDTTANAQTLSLINAATSANLRVATVKGAAISVGSQTDLYKLSVAAGDKITAQTIASGVYGAPIDTVIRILAADGTTVLATNDDTRLGINSINQAGSNVVDNDSLVLNYVAAADGNIFIEVTAKASGTGSYDLVVGNMVQNNFPWQNQSNPLNVNNSTGSPLITAFDVLLVINELNNPQIMNPVTFILPVPSGSVAPPPFLDVTGDNMVTAFDALLVINFLNANPIGPEFVPFSAPEAIEEPAGNSGAASTGAASSSSGVVALAQPASAASQSPTLSQSSSGIGPAALEPNSLTWLLLNPIHAAGEATEASGCGSHEENDQALEEILNEAP